MNLPSAIKRNTKQNLALKKKSISNKKIQDKRKRQMQENTRTMIEKNSQWFSSVRLAPKPAMKQIYHSSDLVMSNGSNSD